MSDREALIDEAARHCRAGRCEKAIAALERVLAMDPADGETQHQLGVCYGGGCREHALVRPEIARVHLLQAVSALGADGPPALQARALADLGHLQGRLPVPSARGRTLAAVECHGKAAEIYRNLGMLRSWAREQHNLGNAWCEVPAGAFPEKWEQAISHYRHALTVRTREESPERFAATLLNLGTAYRERPQGDRGANVRRAIDCYRRSLGVFRPADHPHRNAALHNNLGNAYLSLPAAGRLEERRNVGRGIRHFRRALMVWSRECHRCDYAAAQLGCASALLRLSTLAPAPGMSLGEAEFRYGEASECLAQCGRAPLAEEARIRRDRIQDWLRKNRNRDGIGFTAVARGLLNEDEEDGAARPDPGWT